MSSEPRDGDPSRVDPLSLPTVAAAGSRWATALFARPAELARHTAALAGELARIGLGSSALTPDPGDDRFAAPGWTADPLLRRAVQTHLATTGAAVAMLDDAGLDPADDAVLRGVVGSVADVVAPSNNPVLRALAARRGPGRSEEPPAAAPPVPGPPAAGPPAAGPPAAAPPAADPPAAGPDTASGEPAADVAAPPDGMRRLTVGEEVAATPGAVVLRTDTFELVHYLPQTREVRELPVLVVPPPGVPAYLADLSPGRSLVEHLVRDGDQVLLVSWHPGTAEALPTGSAGADALGQALLDALDAVERISRAGSTVVLGIGDGAVLTSAVLAHLAAVGLQERVAAAVLVGLDPRAAASEGRVPRDLRQWLADAADAPAGDPGQLPAELLGTPVDPAAVDRDELVVTAAPSWTGLAGTGPVEVVETSHTEFVDPPGDEPGSWWATLTEWLGPRAGQPREAPAELGGRGMHAIAPSPGEYVSAR